MHVTLSNEIIITDPTTDVIKFCGDNLVISNPDYYKKQRLGLWIGKTPTQLYLFRRNGNKIYLPAGCLNELIKVIPDTQINYDLADNPVTEYDCKVPLYDYQKTALKSMLTTNYGILQAPCGSGKTQVGISMAASLQRKTLWLTHTTDLLNQSKKRASDYIKDKSLIGTVTAGKVDISEGITFATVQTLSKLDLTQYKYVWDVVIVDECHRCAGTPTSLMMFSKVVNSLAARWKYGLSATVHRGDGLIESTFALLGEVAYVVPEEAVADKTIGVTVQEIKTGVKISDCCLDTDGTLDYMELVSYLATNEERTKLIASMIAENRNNNNLIMSDRIQHLRTILDALILEGVPESEIRMITGTMTSKKEKEYRQQAIEDMKTGKARFLFASYNLAKEGLDIPNLNRLYLALPKKDFAVVTQSIGRICRTAAGKDSAICYDFVDDIGFCEGAWKKRKTIYKKKGCEIIEGVEAVAKSSKPIQEGLFCF